MVGGTPVQEDRMRLTVNAFLELAGISIDHTTDYADLSKLLRRNTDRIEYILHHHPDAERYFQSAPSFFDLSKKFIIPDSLPGPRMIPRARTVNVPKLLDALLGSPAPVFPLEEFFLLVAGGDRKTNIICQPYELFERRIQNLPWCDNFRSSLATRKFFDAALHFRFPPIYLEWSLDQIPDPLTALEDNFPEYFSDRIFSAETVAVVLACGGTPNPASLTRNSNVFQARAQALELHTRFKLPDSFAYKDNFVFPAEDIHTAHERLHEEEEVYPACNLSEIMRRYQVDITQEHMKGTFHDIESRFGEQFGSLDPLSGRSVFPHASFVTEWDKIIDILGCRMTETPQKPSPYPHLSALIEKQTRVDGREKLVPTRLFSATTEGDSKSDTSDALQEENERTPTKRPRRLGTPVIVPAIPMTHEAAEPEPEGDEEEDEDEEPSAPRIPADLRIDGYFEMSLDERVQKVLHLSKQLSANKKLSRPIKEVEQYIEKTERVVEEIFPLRKVVFKSVVEQEGALYFIQTDRQHCRLKCLRCESLTRYSRANNPLSHIRKCYDSSASKLRK